jgi:hypothetical protein
MRALCDNIALSGKGSAETCTFRVRPFILDKTSSSIALSDKTFLITGSAPVSDCSSANRSSNRSLRQPGGHQLSRDCCMTGILMEWYRRGPRDFWESTMSLRWGLGSYLGCLRWCAWVAISLNWRCDYLIMMHLFKKRELGIAHGGCLSKSKSTTYLCKSKVAPSKNFSFSHNISSRSVRYATFWFERVAYHGPVDYEAVGYW